MSAASITIIATLGGFGTAGLGMLWKISSKWTNATDRLEVIERHMKELVDDKNRVHKEITDSMRDDRRATNERLRWLEENFYNRPVSRTKRR